MKRLIVRFRNQDDLNVIAHRLNVNLDDNVKKVDLTGSIEITRKKPTNNRNNKPSKVDKYMEQWVDMPEFRLDFKKSDYAKIEFIFGTDDLNILGDFFEQNITDKTKSIWYPKLVHGQNNNIRVIGGRKARYPIYIVSKGRADIGKNHMSTWLSNCEQSHYIIVEREEIEKYKETYGQSRYCTILELDNSFKENYDVFDDSIGQKGTTGPGAARNFAMSHSKNSGFDWCWCLDDNIEFPGLVRYYRGRRIPAYTMEAFATLEDFVDRYENIGQAGLNYPKFLVDEQNYPPYTTNTRIYSFLLLNNKLEFRWRGRYNEDTDLSLRILKAGYCTVQWNIYTAAKITTQRVKGGNTEEFYAKEGTYAKSKMLEDMHPDVAKVVWKFNRYHHHVDYTGFKQQLKLKPEFEYLKGKNNTIEEHGVRIVRIPKEDVRTERDTLRYILENYDNENYYVDKNLFL